MVLLLSGGCRAGAPAVAETDPEQIIGSIKWEITEAPTGKVIQTGDRQIRLKEVVFSVHKLTEKRIALSDHFRLGIAESPDRSKADKKGFGLTFTRDDRDKLVSWEWFTVNYEDHAYKLQEEGSLRIKIAQVGSGWEVTRMECLSDLSLRAFEVRDERLPEHPTWRARIFKGSFVRWPSLVEGKVVVND
jgi:hypothetical protein